jgi:hypothetical protein
MSETNITGQRCNNILKGLFVAGVWCSRSCVRDHLKPDNIDAVITRINLFNKDVSLPLK